MAFLGDGVLVIWNDITAEAETEFLAWHVLQHIPERVSIPGRPPALDHVPTGCPFHPRCPHAMDVCKSTVPQLVDVRPGHRVACHLVNPPQDIEAHAIV